MPRFPPPPGAAALRAIPPAERVLPTGTLPWRIYATGGAHPARWDEFRTFGPITSMRFDHHTPPRRVQERAILYAATEIATCVAEVFQATRTIDCVGRAPWLAGFLLTAELRLLDLTGPWPTRGEASMLLTSGPRGRARDWSRQIYAAYPHLQGLWYPSSMYAHARSLALYDRAGAALPEAPIVHLPLNDPRLLPALEGIGAAIGYDLIAR